MSCVSGAILDVVVDLRAGSPGFGAWAAVRLDEREPTCGVPVRRPRSRVHGPKRAGHGPVPVLDAICSRAGAQRGRPGPGHRHRMARDVKPILSDKDAAAPSLAQRRAAGCCRTTPAAWLRRRTARPAGCPLTVRSARPARSRPSGGRRRQPARAGRAAVPAASRRSAPGRPAPRRRGRARCTRAAAPGGPARCSGRADPGRVRAPQPEDLLGEPEPGRLAAAGRVVDAGRRCRCDQGVRCGPRHPPSRSAARDWSSTTGPAPLRVPS